VKKRRPDRSAVGNIQVDEASGLKGEEEEHICIQAEQKEAKVRAEEEEHLQNAEEEEEGLARESDTFETETKTISLWSLRKL